MGFPPYDVVGISIPTDVGWEGPKSIVGMVLWPEYLTKYCPGKGWPYMGSAPPDKETYQHCNGVFHTIVPEEE